MTHSTPAIEAQNINLRIDSSNILSGVTSTFPGTGMTGLVGQNGSGKSTLMRILARQLAATTGEVLFRGNPLASFSARAFAQKLAYMPQNVPAAPGMTVRELVSLGRYPWHGALGRFSEADAQEVDKALEITGTNIFSDRIIDSLSGGERQRCWLAMLIAQNAEMLLLDEPISALDLGHQHAMLALLKSITTANYVGAVVILHDINLAAQYCDRIVALNEGELIAEGVPNDIMTPDKLGDIFGIPMLVAPHPGTGKPFCYADPDNISRLGGS